MKINVSVGVSDQPKEAPERKLTNEEKRQLKYLESRKNILINGFVGAIKEIDTQMEEVKSGYWKRFQGGKE